MLLIQKHSLHINTEVDRLEVQLLVGSCLLSLVLLKLHDATQTKNHYPSFTNTQKGTFHNGGE